MPAIAALTINDGAATPVAHIFAPVTTDGAKGQFADRSSGIAAAYARLNHEVRAAAQPGAANRIIIGFSVPVTAVVDGVTKVVRTSSAQVAINCAQESTEQERKDLLAYVANCLGLASVKQTVQNLEPFY